MPISSGWRGRGGAGRGVWWGHRGRYVSGPEASRPGQAAQGQGPCSRPIMHHRYAWAGSPPSPLYPLQCHHTEAAGLAGPPPTAHHAHEVDGEQRRRARQREGVDAVVPKGLRVDHKREGHADNGLDALPCGPVPRVPGVVAEREEQGGEVEGDGGRHVGAPALAPPRAPVRDLWRQGRGGQAVRVGLAAGQPSPAAGAAMGGRRQARGRGVLAAGHTGGAGPAAAHSPRARGPPASPAGTRRRCK